MRIVKVNSSANRALTAKSNGNDIELNGETNDEDMEDGETGFDDGSAQVRNIRDQGQPTAYEHQEHMTTHRIMARVLRDGTWCELAAQEIGCSKCFGKRRWSMCRWILGSLVKRNLKNRSLLCCSSGERRHKITWTMLVPRIGIEFPWIAKRVAKFIDQLGHNRVTFRCDNEPAIEALARELAQGRQEGSQVLERQPAG